MKGLKAAVATVLAASAIVATTSIFASSALADVTSAQLKSTYGAELRVLGEFESADFARGIVVVSGQHLQIGKETKFSYGGLLVADQVQALHMLQPGDMV